MPGFTDTAEYFARAARKERDATRRTEFVKGEAFYRSLATIMPSLPRNYIAPRLNGNRYRDRAEECRTLAEHLTNPECRRQMVALAETYEQSAVQVDGL